MEVSGQSAGDMLRGAWIDTDDHMALQFSTFSNLCIVNPHTVIFLRLRFLRHSHTCLSWCFWADPFWSMGLLHVCVFRLRAVVRKREDGAYFHIIPPTKGNNSPPLHKQHFKCRLPSCPGGLAAGAALLYVHPFDMPPSHQRGLQLKTKINLF